MSSSKKMQGDRLRWRAVILHSLAWCGLGVVVLLVAQALSRTLVSDVFAYALGGLFSWFGGALITLLMVYHVPDLSRWVLAIPFLLSAVMLAMALSLIGFDGRDQTRAIVVVIFWLLMAISAFILPLIAGGELRPLRALASAVIIAVGVPVVSSMVFMVGVAVYLALSPTDYEILPTEALFTGLALWVVIVPTLVGVFLIWQVKISRRIGNKKQG